MEFGWLFVVCLWICSAYADEEYHDPPPKPGILGIFSKPKIPLPKLDIFTKPKIPVLDILTKPKETGFQINKQFVAGTPFGGGSFGFGFGIGGHIGSSRPGHGVNVPPAEKTKPGRPVVDWEEERESVGPRPNWEDKPNPGSYQNKDKPKSETYEEGKKDSRPDWEDIGEIDNKDRSDDLMEGDLIGDGLIQPRGRDKVNKDRIKRFIDSKIYHVALKKGFISNARVSKVKFRRNDNTLNSGM